jgi:hypothetical protein
LHRSTLPGDAAPPRFLCVSEVFGTAALCDYLCGNIFLLGKYLVAQTRNAKIRRTAILGDWEDLILQQQETYRLSNERNSAIYTAGMTLSGYV